MPDPTQEKFWRIKALKCYPKVHAMLVLGKTAASVALYIQKDRKEYTDVGIESLATMLNAYRNDALGTDAFGRIPHIAKSAAREFTDRLSELKVLGNLLDMQMARLGDAYGDEQMSQGKERNPEINKIAKEIRDTANTIHQIKMDLNLTGARNLGTLTISPERMAEMKQKYGDVSEKILTSATSQGRILACLKAAQKYAEMQEQQDHESPDEEEEAEQSKPKALRRQ